MSFDPTVGRWLQEDPDQFGPGDPDLYRYVGNNPTNLIDPSGLEGRWPGIEAKPDLHSNLYKPPVSFFTGKQIPFGEKGATLSVREESWLISPQEAKRHLEIGLALNDSTNRNDWVVSRQC
jgi:hypothetical protein